MFSTHTHRKMFLQDLCPDEKSITDNVFWTQKHSITWGDRKYSCFGISTKGPHTLLNLELWVCRCWITHINRNRMISGGTYGKILNYGTYQAPGSILASFWNSLMNSSCTSWRQLQWLKHGGFNDPLQFHHVWFPVLLRASEGLLSAAT